MTPSFPGLALIQEHFESQRQALRNVRTARVATSKRSSTLLLYRPTCTFKAVGIDVQPNTSQPSDYEIDDDPFIFPFFLIIFSLDFPHFPTGLLLILMLLLLLKLRLTLFLFFTGLLLLTLALLLLEMLRVYDLLLLDLGPLLRLLLRLGDLE